MEPSSAEPISTSTSDNSTPNITQRRTAASSSAQPQDTKPSEKPTPKPTVTDLSDDDEQESNAQAFECNICLDVAKEPVVSHCGHLFCWPCLHQWLETRPNRQSCPVCKAVVSREKVIPLYGRGGSQEDPRSKVPPRPTPTRQEQPEGNRFTWGNNDGAGAGGFHLSFGIGAFPFGFFASALNLGQQFGQQAGGMQQNVQLEEQEFLSKVFLYVAVVFIIWLFLA